MKHQIFEWQKLLRKWHTNQLSTLHNHRCLRIQITVFLPIKFNCISLHFSSSLYKLYPARAPLKNTTKLMELQTFADIPPGEDRKASIQALYQLACLGLTILIAIGGGLLTGIVYTFIYMHICAYLCIFVHICAYLCTVGHSRAQSGIFGHMWAYLCIFVHNCA